MSSSPVAIVTGASQGIGKAIATELAARGYRLSLMSRSDRCLQVTEQLGGIALQGSITEPAYIDALVEHTVDHYGQIDAVVNNSGRHSQVLNHYCGSWDEVSGATLQYNPEYTSEFLDIPDEAWHDDFDLMVMNCIRMARAVTPHLLKRPHAAIVNISGMEAPQPRLVYPLGPVRLALHGFTKVYSDRYAREGIRMNCLLPGVVENATEDSDPTLAPQIPMGRLGTLEEVARAAAFLLSDDASYITGQMLLADGGLNRHL